MRMAKLVSSYLYSGNAWFIESLYESFLHNPTSIDPQWQACFKALQDDGPATQKDVPHTPIQQT